MYAGYARAFRALGHEVGEFNLHVRIARASEWLDWNWRKAGRPDDRPSAADTLYLAGCDVVNAALRGDVDWTLVFTGAYFHPDLFVLLKRAGRRVALALTESPYEDDRQMRVVGLADVVFTNERTSVGRLRAANPNVYYLPHAYDPIVHTPKAPALEPLVYEHDVVFVGTGFHERLEALAAVDWTGIDLGLYGTYELLGSRSKLRKYIRGGVIDNVVTAALYRRAKIGLNLYRRSVSYGRNAPRIDTAESVNPRAIELAACGVFTISDRRAEATEAFGDLVPTFDSPSDLEGLIRRWLADDAGRKHVAARLPDRVARSTFDHRAAQIAAFLGSVQAEMATRNVAIPA